MRAIWYVALFPDPFPPVPPVEIGSFYRLLEEANRNLERLDGITSILPNPYFFIHAYVRKEALLSSQIEGTRSSFFDLLLFDREDALEVPKDNDVFEVSNYVKAMNRGLERIRSDSVTISLGLFREIHEILMSNVRGGEKSPGRFREQQNWTGGGHPATVRKSTLANLRMDSTS